MFYQNQNKWRYKSIPSEVSKNNSDRVIDLAIYKNQYILIKKTDVFQEIITKNLFVDNVCVHIQVKIC